MHGDPLMEVTDAMPEDVVLLKAALDRLRLKDRFTERPAVPVRPLTLNVENAGTAFRFLTAYCAQLPGCEVVLDGCERMHHRPIGPLVDALRALGANIDYVGETGFPPLHIIGTTLHHPTIGDSRTIHHPPSTIHNSPSGAHSTIHYPLSTSISSQFASALELIGVPCDAPASPYLTMTREIIKHYPQSTIHIPQSTIHIPQSTIHIPQSTIHNPQEKDWSSAAFWYEYVALHGGEIELPGLSQDSLQGDKVVADIFRSFGVDTLYSSACVRVQSTIHIPTIGDSRTIHIPPSTIHINFSSCPDLYPAVAMACKELGYGLQATGIENLRYKESDRVTSVEAMLSTPQGQTVMTEHDHRIAMAAMAAGYKVDDEDCVNKSYPNFKRELCKLLSQGEA